MVKMTVDGELIRENKGQSSSIIKMIIISIILISNGDGNDMDQRHLHYTIPKILPSSSAPLTTPSAPEINHGLTNSYFLTNKYFFLFLEHLGSPFRLKSVSYKFPFSLIGFFVIYDIR